MDITPQENSAQPISDDQELAKALAGVLPDEPETNNNPQDSGLQFEETSTSAVPPMTPSFDPTPSQVQSPVEPVSSPEPSTDQLKVPVFSNARNDLEGIKGEALQELRPLIDRVELPAEEKFDTYLMLIRSTDDVSLIAPAHAAAQKISDEKRKAEALLEVIKEIDYLSKKGNQTNA